MKWKYVLFAMVIICGAVGIFIFSKSGGFGGNKKVIPAGTLSLITEPDDGITPVLGMIAGAHRSVEMVMYELDDTRVEAALAEDEARGVAVRVILSGGYRGATSTMNAAAYGYLAAHSVPVRYSPAYFSLTHEKSLVVDGARGFIMTFNLVSKYYPTGRDFGIMDNNARDVAAMERTFNDDWDGASATDSDRASLGGNNGDAGDDLLWSPGSKDPIIDLINGARKSVYIYNEEMADQDVTEALINAAERGVAVYVVMTGAPEWKWEFSELATAGAHVRTYADDDDAPLYIHAKMVLMDQGVADERAFVGSENFSEGSLNENRELGLITPDAVIIAGLFKTFAADWRDAAPFVIPIK